MRALRQDLAARRSAGEPELPLAAAQSDAFDALLRAVLARVAPLAPLAVVAVGSYGRRELAPRADLDLLFLHQGDAEAARPAVESCLYLLWDMKVELGYAARGPEAWQSLLTARELTALTSLLDARVVWGAPGPRAALERLRESARPGLAWLRPALAAEQAARRAKYGGAGFLLEPELKFGEGGLRDLSLFRWLAQAHFGVKELDALAACDALPLRVIEPLLWAWEHLLWLRALLHEEAGRRVDRLTFDKQEALARRAGASIEDLMRDYYRCARAISEGLRELFARAEPEPEGAPLVILAEGFSTRAGWLRTETPERLGAEPVYALRAFAFWGRYRAALHPSCRDALSLALPRLAEEALTLSKDARRELWSLFGEVLVRGGEPFAALHSLGVLGALVPEWAPLSSLWLLDLYHVYTVDAHTLNGLQNLSRFRAGDPAFPFESSLAAQLSDPRPLFLGLLLHDLGKVEGAAGHCERGAALVPRVCARLGLPADDAALVHFLVAGHLVLGQLAFRRDIEDPALIEELAAQVGTEERLRALYLLTVADTAAVGPGRLTDWKATLLRELYARALEVLRRGAARPSPEEEPRDSLSPLAAAVLASLPPARLVYEPKERRARLVETASALLSGGSEGPTVGLLPVSPGEPPLDKTATPRPSPDAFALSIFPEVARGGTEAILCAADAPGFLAKVAGALSAAGVEILEAQIGSFFFEGNTYALDRFWVRDRAGSAEVEPERWERARADLARVLRGEPVEPARSGGAPLVRTRSAPGRVIIEAQGGRVRVEVHTQDRPGLLHELATTLAEVGLSIELAKIMTEAGRVVDVFYARGLSAADLSPERLRTLQQRAESVAALH